VTVDEEYLKAAGHFSALVVYIRFELLTNVGASLINILQQGLTDIWINRHDV